MVQIVVVPSAPLNRCCSCGYCVKAVVVSVEVVILIGILDKFGHHDVMAKASKI